MSLSSSTLASLQKAGAAVFTADEKLKTAVKEYAQRVNATMVANPYGLGNNALFENWKMVARLSQTVSGIEEELKKVYRVAAELTTDDQPTVRELPALAAPKRVVVQRVGSAESRDDLTPTDVLVKPEKKTSAAKKAAASAPKYAGGSEKQPQLNGNAAKLMRHLERVLNANEFTGISQTAVSQETGIALGSMTAAIKKAIESAYLIAGPGGTFKLASAQESMAA